jgi:autoinducer 2 (AI-2) kinase
MNSPAGSTEVGGPISFRPRIYVTAEMDDSALVRLRGLGEVKYVPYRLEQRLLVGEELVDELKGYHIFITEVDLVDAESLLRLPDLRLVIVCRGNPVNVDLRACTAASIPVIHTPARNAEAVADLAVTFLLMLARRLQSAVTFLHEPGNEPGDLGRMGVSNEQFHGVELWHRTVGLIGGGAIGHKVIQRLLPFGARILLYDPYLSDEQATLLGVQRVPLDQLLAESDFISLHAPVTDETREIMNARAFTRMKPGAFLVNTARAALVNQSALLEALRSGQLGGAALDVFPVEPPGSDDPLLICPNVIATPHVGGNTAQVASHQGEMAIQAITDLLAGRSPAHILNESILPAFTWTGRRPTNEALLQTLAKGPGPGATDLDQDAQTRKPAAPWAETQPIPIHQKAESMANNSLEIMTGILKEFTARIAVDPHMLAFAKGKNVVFSFSSKDSDHAFFLSFINGQVGAGLGSPPREPDVRLKMSLDTLDGMFTGRVNATRAATSGRLSFSGDTGKAMAFMRIQKDMNRLYSECRARIGDPGDLTGVISTPAPAASLPASVIHTPVAAQPVEPVVAVAAREEKTGDIRDLILSVTNELYAKGMITPTGGNVSARCEDNPSEFWITPTSIFKGDLHPDMLIRIDMDGHPKLETNFVASSEWRVHAAIYQTRPEMNSVIHTHAPQATLMALTNTPFLPISTEAAFLGEVPVVPFIMPGTDKLAEAVVAAMGSGFACIMQNHGLVVAGSSLRRAADMTDVVEVTAHKLMVCRQLGITPPLLPEEIVAQMKEIGEMAA